MKCLVILSMLILVGCSKEYVNKIRIECWKNGVLKGLKFDTEFAARAMYVGEETQCDTVILKDVPLKD